METIELFSGIGGFRIACDALTIKTIWANDLDPMACKVYKANFGRDALKEGDIRELKESVPPHDILTAGFPCQSFSSAGKKQGIRDPRGTLFNEVIHVIKRCLPEYFLLENVKRLLTMESGDHFSTILNELSKLPYFIEWRLLNACKFGLAQNRQRLFIIGRKIKSFGDASICLANKWDLCDLSCSDLETIKRWNDWTNIRYHQGRFPFWGIAYNGKFYAKKLENFSEAQDKVKLKEFLEESPAEIFYMDDSTKRRIGNSVYVNKYWDGVQILYNQKGGARMGYTVFGTEGLSPTLTASHSRHYERYKIGERFRRLTNVEYAKLQGFPDQHCEIASVFKQYGLFGNAVPPPMAKWVIERAIAKDGLALDEIESFEGTQKLMQL